MRNWLLTMLMAVVAITLICCNQKDEFNPAEEGIANETLQNELNDIPGERIYAEVNEDGDYIVSLTDGEEGSDAVAKGKDYCVYLVKSVNGNVNCPFFHLVGFEVCVNCPDNTTDCPGIVGQYTNYRYLRNGVEMCRGRWKLQAANCTECPPDGKKGFVFVD